MIQRKMSNGGEETYEVIDPGFHEGIGGIKAHYQMTHRKLGLPEAERIRIDCVSVSEPQSYPFG